MIRSIVDDMAANVGQEPPTNETLAKFTKWVRDPPLPKYATDENRPVMLESFINIIYVTSLATFRNRASWSRRQTPATSLAVDRHGNEIERPIDRPLMLLSALPPDNQESMSESEEVKPFSYV